ncbi:MAG TPA: ATP-grasp domain-containing protein [Acidobacteriaceae bacterium]|nr:ATP-grasp domain-containing protein [Acidobacteriaceae bacterium]
MQPKVVIAASSWWPLAAKIAVSLLDHGCRVEAVCAPGQPLRFVRGISRYHHYSRVRSLESLKDAIRAASPDVIIPCDDGVVLQLHQLYKEQPDLRAVISRSLGEATHFDVTASREGLQNVAQELGIRVPRSTRVRTQTELEMWFDRPLDRAVLKQDGTWGGRGVRVVDSRDEAAAELEQMLKPLSWVTVGKRMIVDRDPIALWGRKDRLPVVTLQEYIPGRPANLMMACWQGEVLGSVTAEVQQAQGATSAAMVIKLIDHPEIKLAASKLAKRLCLSGFYGVDFILEEGTRAAYLLELNPRCTQLGHLPIDGQGDLVGLLCRQLGVILPVERQLGLRVGDTVAFFPKVISLSGELQHAYQDTPWQRPELVEELLKPSYPDRRWPSRLYHWLRPARLDKPVNFAERNSDPAAAAAEINGLAEAREEGSRDRLLPRAH